MSAPGYESTANALVQRILDLPHDKVMACESAWGLLKIEGFKFQDLQPSAFQASWAFAKAREIIGGAK